MNLFPRLSSVRAEQLQPVDPHSDSSSGNPQTCLFLKAALTRSLPCGSLYILLLPPPPQTCFGGFAIFIPPSSCAPLTHHSSFFHFFFLLK